jgi:phosphate transport system substrate-binding protein
MLSSDFRVSITDPTQNEAYPIASFTWLLLPKELNDAGKKTTLTALLHWVLTAGQKQCSVLGYAPLPSDIAKQALQALGEMQ